jgi:hypothetical protein
LLTAGVLRVEEGGQAKAERVIVLPMKAERKEELIGRARQRVRQLQERAKELLDRAQQDNEPK